MNKNKLIVPTLIIAMLLVLVGVSVSQAQTNPEAVTVNNYAEGGIVILGGSGGGTDTLGATGTRFPSGVAVGSGASVDTTGAFSVGNDGSQLSELITGTCNISQTSPGSHAATTTAEYFCAVTGVENGDKVFASLPEGASKVDAFGSWTLTNAYATSSDFIYMDLLNLTGGASSTFSTVTSSVQYWIAR